MNSALLDVLLFALQILAPPTAAATNIERTPMRAGDTHAQLSAVARPADRLKSSRQRFNGASEPKSAAAIAIDTAAVATAAAVVSLHESANAAEIDDDAAAAAVVAAAAAIESVEE